jgi:ABC-type molybdate transport system permease subunit
VGELIVWLVTLPFQVLGVVLSVVFGILGAVFSIVFSLVGSALGFVWSACCIAVVVLLVLGAIKLLGGKPLVAR